jgi:hypothetical protein
LTTSPGVDRMGYSMISLWSVTLTMSASRPR